MCKEPLACQDPGCKVRVDGGQPCRGRKAVMLQCECGVALCVPCARTQVTAANGGDYRESAVGCPKCKLGPTCFTVKGAGVATLRVGDNMLCPADLPLGPVEALQFVEHKALDLYLHGQPVSNACCICLDPIAPGNTAFSMCACSEVGADARLSHILPPLLYLIGVPCVCSGSAGRVPSRRWVGRAHMSNPSRTSTSTRGR